MILTHLEYWPAVLLIIAVLIFTTVILERKFFRIIKTYWFYKRSAFSYISSVFFLAGLALLALAILDLRGPEEKIKADVPSDRTIILLDTSASMLAEDIKPSRLEKAVLIAKHFARRAGGQQISIVAFAEIQKKIVPFTNDLDLIDSRLDSLKNIKNHYGSSALTMALQESIQYFKETSDEAEGNILVLTDGEETAEGLDLQIPKSVRIALVGIGTEQGGRIPLDDDRGLRFGYKKHKGRDVITKLNENFFKSASSDIPSSKYWIASSFSLPSDEVLDFFRSEKTKGQDKQDMILRPVLMEYLVVPAILLLILSYLLKFLRIYTLGILLLITQVDAQEEKKDVKISPEVATGLVKLQKGELGRLEKLDLANKMHKDGLKDESLTLYRENLNPSAIEKDIPPEAYMNLGTALLEKGDVTGGLKTYDEVLRAVKGTEKEAEIKKTINQNIVTYFRQQEENKQQNKDQQKKQDENQDKQDNQPSSGGQDQKPQKGQEKKDKQNKSGQSDEQKNAEQREKGDKGDQDQKKGEEDKDNDKSDEKDSDQQQNSKPLPPKKLPAKLKQLMSDDRQLQMKIIEHGTRDMNKRRSQKSKDW